MTALVLVQHGDKQRTPGDPGLTRRGSDQARRTAFALGQLGPPLAVYSSPLKRAAETASLIAGHFGLTVHDDDPASGANQLGGSGRAVDLGVVADWECTNADRDFVPSTGDSSRYAAQRMLAAITDIATRHPTGTTVVVTHGGVTVDLLRTLLDEHDESVDPALLVDGVPSCGLTVLRWTSAGWHVERIASDDHLSDL